MLAKERLIVALDVDTKDKALELAAKLRDRVGIFKIGLELFSSCGPEIVRDIRKTGARVFLDLKFHDIPNTAAKAAASVTKLGVFMLNVHALGGYDMMKKCAESVRAEASKLKIEKPLLIAVTILTSMDENSLKKAGLNDNMESQVLRLSLLAKDAGLDGVVASPSEVKSIRERTGEDFLIVTPGVRPLWAAADDQKRFRTPEEAIKSGADYIVVGRPITGAADPVEAARKVLEEMGTK